MRLVPLAIVILGCASPKAPIQTPTQSRSPKDAAAPVTDATQPTPQRYSIRGRIASKEGAPITGKRVEAWRNDRSCWSDATSDADGRFEFPNLEPGTYVLTTTTNTGRQTASVVLGDADTETRLVQDVNAPHDLVDRPPLIHSEPRCERLQAKEN